MKKIKVGVSACVIGEKVRFDSGHKRSFFVAEELSDFLDFIPVCPEVGIGLSIPRPAIRLFEDEKGIRLVDTKDVNIDHTAKMKAFSENKINQLAKMDLCGYIVCAKSPTCGMERVKVYQNTKQVASKKTGVGLFTQHLLTTLPWLPVEEDGRLNDPILRENFVFRLFALHDFYQSLTNDISRSGLIKFHSRYKLVLLAHSPVAYKSLGQLVSRIANYDIEDFYLLYRASFMQAIKQRASRKNNTNVLMHLQGYFKRSINSRQKEELSNLIKAYHIGDMPLLAPLTLINHYLGEYPDPYLQNQVYLHPYPEKLRLRYGL